MAFHLANVIAHLLSAWVVFEILLIVVELPWAAFAGALVFAIHPLQTEAVAWATGMKDVPSGLLGVIAIWQYLVARREKSPERYTLAIAAFAVALLAKPSTVCVPVICAILDLFILRTPWRDRVVAGAVAIAGRWMRGDRI